MNPLTLFLLTALVLAFLDLGQSIWSESAVPQRT